MIKSILINVKIDSKEPRWKLVYVTMMFNINIFYIFIGIFSFHSDIDILDILSDKNP